MRIIAGNLKGRQFASPNGNRTHPMSEKGRGALFNALGDIEGLSLLDAFAGSGAIGFEALSRGAARATLIENSRLAQNAITDNIKTLGLTQTAKLIKASADAWLATTNERFDLVILDPPFENLQMPLLSELAERTKSGGVVVFSLPPKAEVALTSDYHYLNTKHYSDNQLVFYRRLS